jgi:hypothetical protein
MAKGQLRGNREAKKPKQPKKSPSPSADLAWKAVPTPSTVSVPAKKK